MSVKLLTEHNLRFRSLKRGCTDSFESTLVKVPHCWKSHVSALLANCICSIFGMFLLTGSTVLGLRTSDGLACLPDTDLDGGTPTFFPALEGGVLDPLDPADPRELALLELFALPEREVAIPELIHARPLLMLH